MLCPHCKNEINNTSPTCSLCGADLQKSSIKRELTDEQKYIYKRLVECGLYKYRDKENIFGKELSKEDEFYLRLETIDMLKENSEIIRRQEGYLCIIKNILIFFTVIIVVATILGVFLVIENSEKSSKRSYMYSYEQNMSTYKDL